MEAHASELLPGTDARNVRTPTDDSPGEESVDDRTLNARLTCGAQLLEASSIAQWIGLNFNDGDARRLFFDRVDRAHDGLMAILAVGMGRRFEESLISTLVTQSNYPTSHAHSNIKVTLKKSAAQRGYINRTAWTVISVADR